jgi:hypothetical protein
MIAGAMTRVVEEREPANVQLTEESYRVLQEMAALDRASKLNPRGSRQARYSPHFLMDEIERSIVGRPNRGEGTMQRTARYLTAVWVVFLPCMADAADAEAALSKARDLHGKYWLCLVKEAVVVLPKGLSRADFALLAKAACPAEAQRLRGALIDYWALKSPEMPVADHMAKANVVISEAVDDIVDWYIDPKLRGESPQ